MVKTSFSSASAVSSSATTGATMATRSKSYSVPARPDPAEKVCMLVDALLATACIARISPRTSSSSASSFVRTKRTVSVPPPA